MKVIKALGSFLGTLILASVVMNAPGQSSKFLSRRMEEVDKGGQLPLEEQLRIGKERVELLHSKACKEHPELVHLEKELDKIEGIYETEEYKELELKMKEFLKASKETEQSEPGILNAYEVLRIAYIRKWKSQTVPIYYGDEYSREQFMKSWGKVYSYVDYIKRGSVGEQRDLSWDEIESLVRKSLKEDMERGFEDLAEVQKTYTFPPFVVRYCDLWAEANLSSEALRVAISQKTSDEYRDTCRWVDWLKICIEKKENGS